MIKIGPDRAKSEGITYHMFPKDAELCNAWLEALRISKFAAYYRRVICSRHFREDDFWITKQGKRKLKLGAVPYLDDCYGPAALTTCKICLKLDAKMYQLKNGLEKMYQDVMGIEPRVDHLNRLPMAICWECTARLQSAAAFKSKALYSDELLHQHLLTNADLKILHIKRILKEKTLLQSSMAVQQVFKFDSLDDEDHAPNTFIKAEVIGIPNNEETELELQSLATDKMTDKDERKTSIIAANFPASEFKTEVHIIPPPISEVEIGDDTNFDDYYKDGDYETVSENIYIENANLDSANVSTNEENLPTDFDNISRNQEKIETNNVTKIMETNDEELLEMAMNLTSDEEKPGDFDDEGIQIQLNNKTMCVKKRKKRKKSDEEVIVWVKGRRTQQFYHATCGSIPDRNSSSATTVTKLLPSNRTSLVTCEYMTARYGISQRVKSAKNSFQQFPISRDIMLLHKGLKPFKCEACGKTFRTSTEQRAHVDHVHLKKPRPKRVRRRAKKCVEETVED